MRKSILFILVTLFMISTVLAADTQIPTVSPKVDILGDGQIKVSGTASDVSNDNNVTAGISRVEVRLNSGNWITASGTTSFDYTFSDLSEGNHVVSVRSIDKSLNPSDIVIIDVSLTSEDVPIKDDDLTWYISISDLNFQTADDYFNVMSVEEGTDVNINFDIDNDYDEPVNLRWIISKGTYEIKDNVQIRPDKSESVSEWISGAYITKGTQRFTIEVIDWDTKETIEEKTLTLTVTEKVDDEKSSVSSSSTSTDEIPDWFLVMAEQNDWKIPEGSSQEISELESQVKTHEEDIKTLRSEIATLKTTNANLATQNTTANSAGFNNGYVALAVIGVALYIKRDWVKEQLSLNQSSGSTEPASEQPVQQDLRN